MAYWYPSCESSICQTSFRWMCAFLINRHQRVKVDKTLSEWMSVGTGMPQGSYLGPLTFIILIDDLRPRCLTHKYIDDTSVTETIKEAASDMQSFIDDLVKQSTDNGINVNERKTKEMLIGSIVKDQPPQLTLNGAVIESHQIQAARILRLQQSQEGSARKRNILQGPVLTLLFETAQTLHRRLTVLLHNSGASSARVCLSGLALESDRRPTRGTGGVTEAGYANHFQPQWLSHCAYHRRYWQPPGPSRTSHRTSRSERKIISALPPAY